MSDSESTTITFKTMGNRQVLTRQQLVEDPWLADFVKRFENCFEADPFADVFVFYPKGKDFD